MMIRLEDINREKPLFTQLSYVRGYIKAFLESHWETPGFKDSIIGSPVMPNSPLEPFEILPLIPMNIDLLKD